MSDETDNTQTGKAISENRLAARLDRIEAKLEKLTEPVVEDQSLHRNKMHRWVHRAERWWGTRIALLILALGAGTTFWVLIEERNARAEERIARTEERIARAWRTLSAPTAGNSGKGAAINFLNDQGQKLSYFDLGGSAYARVDVRGVTGLDVYIEGADLSYSDWWSTKLNYLSMSSTSLRNMSLSGTFEGFFSRVDGYGLDIFQGEFNEGQIYGTEFEASILDGARIDTSVDDASLAPLEQTDDDGNVIPGEFVEPAIETIIYDSSLRCSGIINVFDREYEIFNSNLSGALIDTRVLDEKHKETYTYAETGEDGLPDIVIDRIDNPLTEVELSDASRLKDVFIDSWYFSDNPPLGLPPNILTKLLESRDRQKMISACQNAFPNGLIKDGVWDRTKRTSAICASLEKRPRPCDLSTTAASRNAAEWLLKTRFIAEGDFDLGITYGPGFGN